MIKSREWLDLQTLVHNKQEFGKLNPLLQKQIFDFFRHSHNLNQKREKIENLKIKISKERVLIKRLSKSITKEFNYITNEMSLGRQSIYITPEFTGKSYRIDIDWKGKRKKLTIGKTLNDVKKLLEKHNPKIKINITQDDFKEVIKKYFRSYIEEKITSITREKFEMLSKIKIDKHTLEIIFLDKKDELDKKVDKPTKKKSSVFYGSISGVGGGQVSTSNISFLKTSNPFKRPTTVEDVPKKFQIKGVDKMIKISKKKK
jgi:hypothetical protein